PSFSCSVEALLRACVRHSSTSLANSADNTANIIAAPARRGQPRRRPPPGRPAARFAAERQGRAPQPVSCPRETERREHPRSPGRERAPSTNPSSPARRRAKDRRCGTRHAPHREPAVGPGAPLPGAPSKFSKKRKKPLSGVSTKDVV